MSEFLINNIIVIKFSIDSLQAPLVEGDKKFQYSL